MRPHSTPTQQSGAALALALFLLVVITLLGITAMRASQLSLKLSANEESRIDASESAQSLVDALLASSTNFPVLPATDTQVSCYGGGNNLTANTSPFFAPFSCSSGSLTPPATKSGKFQGNSYVEVFRESVNGSPLVTANAVSTEGSSYKLQFARFRITAGYNRAAEGRGVAEVQQGVYIAVPASSVTGVNLFQ